MIKGVIDSDRHVAEPLSMWKEYLPEELKHYAPTLRDQNELIQLAERSVKYGSKGSTPLLPQIMVGEHPLYYKFSERAQIEVSLQSQEIMGRTETASTGAGQLATMDEMGVDRALIYPTDATFLVNHEKISPEVSAAFAGTYNQWAREYCSADAHRLVPVGVVSRHDPDLMLEELMRIHRWGWRNVLLRPEKINGRVLGHPDYEPFWDACEQLGFSVALKSGTHLYSTTIGLDRFESRFALHACSHYMEAHQAFLSLLESGVLERHPKLRFAFMEAGASWLPAWLFRLDHVCYEQMPGELEEHVQMEPSEYFRRQCWIGFELEEPGLQEVVKAVGIEKLLWGSDYPHPDHELVYAQNLTSDTFSEAELKRILTENPKGFFRM